MRSMTLRPVSSTWMGAPRSSAEAPRRMPSVLPMARQRTQLLPRCCCTSATILLPSTAISTALLTDGSSSPGNSTSTTVPMTCTTLPLAMASPLFGRRCGPPAVPELTCQFLPAARVGHERLQAPPDVVTLVLTGDLAQDEVRLFAVG